MSKKNRFNNYTRYSAVNETPKEIINDDPVVEAGPAEEPVTEEVEVIEPEPSLVEEPEIPLPEKANSKRGVVANCTAVNVRSNPNADASVSLIINSGEEVDVLEEIGDFYRVTVRDSFKGFINKNYVAIK